MRRWWKMLGLVAAAGVGLGVPLSATAQFGGDGPPPPPPPKESPFSMKDDGAPNAFSDMFGVRSPSVSLPSQGPLQRLLPGIFSPRYTAGVPASFPNPAQPCSEEASPFKMQEGGMPNGFTEMCAPQPGHGLFGGRTLLYNELVEGPNVAEPYTLTFRNEALYWHVAPGPSAVPLVTTTNNFPVEIGALGQPNTQVLFGGSNETFQYGNIPGFRSTMGIATGYFPPIEISGFLVKHSTGFSAGSLSNPNQLLVVPVQDVSQPVIAGIGSETAILVAVPQNLIVGEFGGIINISSQLSLWGVEAIGILDFAATDFIRLSGLVGYRHLQLDETVTIFTETGGPVSSGVFFGGNTAPAGFFDSSTDRFGTQNSFDGGQVGLRGVLTFGRWSLFSDAKVALGNNHEVLNIGGYSNLIPASGHPVPTLPGGIFALPSNSGSFSQNQITIAPEVNLALSFQLHRNFRLFAGYDVLYMNNVIRPGDAINNVVDSRQMPTFGVNYNPNASTATPGPPGFLHRDFFAQGFFFGIEIGF